ncbi:Transposase [Tepidibacter formicigenes DSM 15518]|jgi:transposase|uniref:Transposase n=1 Tax=Tepidibacter formicigenes DSM 15518 TaxID=1123349 RepID=A0A1M6JMJ3_9FIRM|nr:Transposase [Tepidibacter formicigenes DSM 15518]
MDMYSPYMTLVKKLFPKAKIVIDRFHIIQLFHRAFNKTRIKLMNSDDKNYYKYKKYWKLLLKDASKVDYVKMSFHRSFKKNMREIDIINYLLDQNSELKASYNLYQSILHAVKTKNYQLLESILNNNHSDISNYMKTSIKSIKKYKDYIKNTFKCDYTNGLIEGINNKIKVIKRISFGYKSFFHFKNRILISQDLLKLKAV